MNLLHNTALYIVPTPIGNLLDITHRALKILKEVNLIAAENIYHTNILLQYFKIKNSLISLNKNNEKKQSIKLIQELKKGKNIALVSDAGTPIINDPGYILVNACYSNNIKIVSLPGACAAITALSASGISANRFCYEGFLPSKKTKRCNLLRSLKKETRTIIFYESKHRILDSIRDIVEQIDSYRKIAIAKEITKKWESIRRDQAIKIFKWLKTEKSPFKGEIVIIIDGFKEIKNAIFSDEIIKTFFLLRKSLSFKESVSITSKIYKINKNHLYEYAVKKNNDKNI